MTIDGNRKCPIALFCLVLHLQYAGKACTIGLHHIGIGTGGKCCGIENQLLRPGSKVLLAAQHYTATCIGYQYGGSSRLL
jgi:hypothetical protein